MERLCDLRRVLADTRIYFNQPAPTRLRRCSDQAGAGATLPTELRLQAGDWPEWHPFAVWHRRVLIQR